MAAVLCVSNILGWLFKIEFLVRPHPNSAIMQFTTAAGCLLGAVGLAAVFLRRRKAAAAMAVVVASYCVYALIANGLDVENTWLDHLIGVPFAWDTISARGRTSTLTAISLLAVASVIAVNLSSRNLARGLVGTLLSALVVSPPVFALTAYIGSMFVSFGWGASTGMSLLTAITMALLGAGCGLISWSSELEVNGPRWRFIHPYAAGAAVITAVLGLIMSVGYEARESDTIRARSAREAAFVKNQLEVELTELLHQSERMADRVATGMERRDALWRKDAQNYIRDIDGLRAILWLTRDGVRAAELAPNSSVIPERTYEVAKEYLGDESAVFGAKLPENLACVIMVVPATESRPVEQWLLFTFDLNRYMVTQVPQRLWDNFDFSISHDGATIFERITGAPVDVGGLRADTTIELPNSEWDVSIAPTIASVASERTHLSEAILIAAFLVGTMFALSVQLGMRSRKQADALAEINEDLVDERARLAQVIDTIPDPVFTVDKNGIIEDVNPAAETVFRREESSFIGRSIDDLFPPEVVKSIAVDRRKTGGLDFLRGAVMSIDAVRADGDEFRAAVTVSGIEGHEGEKYLWTVKDISTELRLEFERRSLTRALEEKNRELESIVYTASHDLRSPLVNLHGFSEELRRSCLRIGKIIERIELPEDVRTDLVGVLDTDVPEALGFIQASTRKMDQLIKGLLKISRLGRVELRMRRLDMNDLVQEVLSATQFQLDSGKANVSVAELPPCIGDHDQISQVFANLIDNAIKYADPSRPLVLKIHGRLKSKDAIYYIEDNGVGISPDHRQRVFEVFHRLDPNDAIGGEGLGLTIVRRVVDRHNGSVDVESNSPHGSRFVVTLPAARLMSAESTKKVAHAGVEVQPGERNEQPART